MKLRIIPKEKKLGMSVEREHDDITHGKPEMINKIVMAHLKEDPNYYSKIKKVIKED